MSATSICPCTNLRAIVTGEQFIDSNLRMMKVSFRCEGCGIPFKVIGAFDGVSLEEPSTMDDGQTTWIPIVPCNDDGILGQIA